MIVSTETIENFTLKYPLEKIAPLEEALFFDIETTGFTAGSSKLYLIGCAYYKDDNWQLIQYLAENYDEEKDLLAAFFTLAAGYRYLIHFNGDHFDIPYLNQKVKEHELPYSFDDLTSIDIYRRIAPYRFFLKMNSCKQKSVEEFLGIHRVDPFSGRELIEVYRDYVTTPTSSGMKALLLHNADDLRGMLQILPILAYYDLFNEIPGVKKVTANYYRDQDNNTSKELLITIIPSTPLPVLASNYVGGFYFRGEGDEAVVKVPIFEGELKYFYSNYKDYYYLPEEDLALHKSVATFVDKEYRVQATASTCYTRKISDYLPQAEVLFEPIFRRDYKGKEMFFELTDSIKRDRSAFGIYASHILNLMALSY